MTHTWDGVVRALRDHVRWPKLGPDEKLDVEVRRDSFRTTLEDEIVISAYRYSKTEPLRYHREVHGIVDPEEIRRYERTGYKDAFIRGVHRVMQRLALILSAKPPQGWRLFGRAPSPKTRWSRLFARPMRAVPLQRTLPEDQ